MSDSSYPAPSGGSGGEPTRASIEKELAAREESIQLRIDDLEEEIASTPAAIKASITKHPILGLAGAVAAGLAVGLLVTRRRKPDVAPLHQRLVEQYIAAVGEDVAHRVRRGRTIEDAVRKAMEGRAPLVVYAPTRTAERESKGFLSQVADIGLKTALGFAVKVAIDVASSAVEVEELQEMMAAGAEGNADGGTGATPSGDGAAGTTAGAR